MLPASPSRKAANSPRYEPSPSRRISPSPGRERSVAHKRGCSLESGLPLELPKDEGLTLFTNMKSHEGFLLQESEDFDESISKLRYLPDYKLGVDIPSRRDRGDLLNVEGDKNDYDWLLTPPETPLFRSLDDDEQQCMVQNTRGRTPRQVASLSRSSTLERARISSRSSASPNRLSPSPRSSVSNAQSNSRISPSSRYSPPPPVRQSTISRKPSPPPAAKPLANSQRSASPIPRRLSIAPGCQSVSSGRRGTSPIQSSRGTSSSPKARVWDPSIPGLPSDAPRNLLTSLSDRTASRARGLSPTYTSEMDSVSKYRRQSMSPTPSRGASSSHSNERGRLSPYGKASTASSGEDDMESTSSTAYSSRQNSMLAKSRPIASSRKPFKGSVSNSVPKRSFDSAVWLMDNKKAPQNMFRPLLSSVPATLVVTGKVNAMHRPMFSWNSSLTTSSNASSEMGGTVAPYMDSDHDQSDLGGEWEHAEGSDFQDDIFALDKLDKPGESDAHEYEGGTMNRTQCPHGSSGNFDREREMNTRCTSVLTQYSAISSEDQHGPGVTACSQCGKLFHLVPNVDGFGLCEYCSEKLLQKVQPEVETYNPKIAGAELSSRDSLLLSPSCILGINECSPPFIDNSEKSNGEALQCLPQGKLPMLITDGTRRDVSLIQASCNVQNGGPKCQPELNTEVDSAISISKTDLSNPEYYSSDLSPSYADCSLESRRNNITECGKQQTLAIVNDQSESFLSKNLCDNELQPNLRNPSILEIRDSHGTGISVLLQRTSSNKWPIVQRPLASTGTILSEPYHARDNSNPVNCNFALDNSSAASSVDVSFSKQEESQLQCLRFNRKVEVERAFNNSSGAQSTYSVSDMSISGSSAQVCTKSDTNDDFCSPSEDFDSKVSGRMSSTEEFDSLCCEQMVCGKGAFISKDSSGNLTATTSDWFGETAIEEVDEHTTLHVADSDHLQSNGVISLQKEDLVNLLQSTQMEENCTQFGAKDNDLPVTLSSSSMGDLQQLDLNSEDLQIQTEGNKISSEVNIPDEELVSTLDVNSVLINSAASDIECSHAAKEESSSAIESTSRVEEPKRQLQRSFTLEEATDTILFCSSIIHDLAYKAAAIGIEKETESQMREALRPTVTVDKSIPKPDYLNRTSNASNKHNLSTRKVKRKRLEAGTLLPSAAETGESAKSADPEIMTGAVKTLDSIRPPKLESKCNCTIM